MRPYHCKHFVFDHFWAITLVLLTTLVGLTLWWVTCDLGDWRLLVTLWGSVLSGLYLIQKQKLEETQLFVDLFESFNHRYDEMNEDLNDLVASSEKEDLRDCEKDLLYRYFNLCAEEYLFYQRGYIPPEVWTAWKNGMRMFMQDDRVRELWSEEKQSESYYGLEMPVSGRVN
jgi:hypothetical protein